MRTDIVLTLTGADRVGIVEEVTKVVLDLSGNVETSRMARLGGVFAVLMLVSFDGRRAGALESALEDLASRGYTVTASQTQEAVHVQTRPGWRTYRIEIDGADHEGIIHQIASGLSELGISIESMDTSVSPASMSGTLLFSMRAEVIVPPKVDEATWIGAIDDAGKHSQVDVRVTPV